MFLIKFINRLQILKDIIAFFIILLAASIHLGLIKNHVTMIIMASLFLIFNILALITKSYKYETVIKFTEIIKRIVIPLLIMLLSLLINLGLIESENNFLRIIFWVLFFSFILLSLIPD